MQQGEMTVSVTIITLFAQGSSMYEGITAKSILKKQGAY